MNDLGGRVASILIGLATAIVIVALAILPFLTPQWVAFEQGRAQAAAWTGFTTEELRTATDAILADLVFGGDFDVEVDGTPVLNRARAGAHGRRPDRVPRAVDPRGDLGRSSWSSRAGGGIGRGRGGRSGGGALGLTVGVVVVGVVGLVAFDQLFEIFHEVFFPAGSYLFDPATDRLVQLFPFQFWEETAMVVGVVIIAIVARRRRRGRAAGATITPTRRDRPPDLATVAGTRARERADRARAALSVEAARDAVLAVAEPVGTERIAAADALGRVTAETVTAARLAPALGQLRDGRLRDPRRRHGRRDRGRARSSSEVIGDIAAGAAPDVTVDARARAARIATGARLPDGRRRGRPGRGDDAARCRRPTRAARPRRHGPAAGRLPRPRTRSSRAARSARPAAT